MWFWKQQKYILNFKGFAGLALKCFPYSPKFRGYLSLLTCIMLNPFPCSDVNHYTMYPSFSYSLLIPVLIRVPERDGLDSVPVCRTKIYCANRKSGQRHGKRWPKVDQKSRLNTDRHEINSEHFYLLSLLNSFASSFVLTSYVNVS